MASPQHPFHASTRLQNQMFDAASNFPAPRKQNIACDACRTRKVRCIQAPGADKCAHCQSKNYPCTHFAQQATSERKRTSSSGSSRSSKSRTNSAQSPLDGMVPSPSQSASSALALSLSPSPLLNSPGATPSNPTLSLLLWLFAPTQLAPLPPHIGGASFQAQRHVILGVGRAAADRYRNNVKLPDPDWGDIGKSLQDERFLAEFALDLIEVYMQICHTRQPILDPIEFRARFKLSLPPHLQPQDTPHNPQQPLEPLPPALLAIVLAWGSKFSEHPLLIRDREQSGGNRLSRMLIGKAIDIAESERVYKYATTDNILTCMVLEGIQSHAKNDPDRYNKWWVDNAIRLMMELGVNRNQDRQGSLVFCWWIACLSDAIGAAYLRRKPMLDDDDYDTRDLAGSPQFGAAGDPVLPAGVQAAYLSWYASLHALARIIRQMCRWLWVPSSEDGIPYDKLTQLEAMFSQWRDEHLDRVGVPSNFEADWDFVAAVTACSSDATFHLMWIIMAQAVEDHGIKEYNELVGRPGDHSQDLEKFEALRAKLTEEAQHGALRIAGLAGVLTTNGYLRLDPNALHYAIFAAGHLLANAGAPEVQNCIEGLKQYGLAYEDALDQAAELEQIYATQLATDPTTSPQSHVMQFDAGQAHAMALAFSNGQGMADFSNAQRMPTFSQNFPELYHH